MIETLPVEQSGASNRGIEWLVEQLDACRGILSEFHVRDLLQQADLNPSGLGGYIEQRKESYSRRRVVRRENYELLVLTWMPSQGSVAHDHSGSLCGLKIVQGDLTEKLFVESADGRVRKESAKSYGPGDVLIDPGEIVHSIANISTDELLVTVHLYSPPLPEVRRYAVTQEDPPELFLRPPAPNAQTVAIVGGGFTGLMVLANLLHYTESTSQSLHVVLIDRQPAPGEGVAYRTVDGQHLLNVPASRMSAWPDSPDDFLRYAQSKDPSVCPNDFLPRKIYGEYVRECMLKLAKTAGKQISASILHDEVVRLRSAESGGWEIETASARTIYADLAILTVGHRPPRDPLRSAWAGPRTRFVADPWAALALSQIGPEEPVLLIGSGLTAVDVVLTLNRPDRIAPLLAISRRGLMPMTHLREQMPAAGLPAGVTALLDSEERLTARRLVHAIRRSVGSAEEPGLKWQQVIDGLRPATSRLWTRLDGWERARFLRHARPFWEIHRHRMAPAVADTINQLRHQQKLEVAAGMLLAAKADDLGVDVVFSCRGGSCTRKVRVSWVINCAGPGAHNCHETHLFLRPLLEEGVLSSDEFGLGLLTDDSGHAVGRNGEMHEDLLVAGTLRKATLWESTAVPELRQQAKAAAQAALAALSSRRAKLVQRDPALLDG
jgi:uncharacterized NAD(P)/FAD-binding protein YdhS